MSRLNDALQHHEAKLHLELQAAAKKRNDLTDELTKLDDTIMQTRLDLTEVRFELEQRGIRKPEPDPQPWLIAEE